MSTLTLPPPCDKPMGATVALTTPLAHKTQPGGASSLARTETAPPVACAEDATQAVATPSMQRPRDERATTPSGRKNKKRARLDSTSPSPRAAAATTEQDAPATRVNRSSRPRNLHTRLQLRSPVPDGSLVPPAMMLGAVTRSEPPAHRPRPAVRDTGTRQATQDENRPGLALHETAMELDLPLTRPNFIPADFGAPLESLDLNRVRFPNAYRRSEALPALPRPRVSFVGQDSMMAALHDPPMLTRDTSSFSRLTALPAGGPPQRPPTPFVFGATVSRPTPDLPSPHQPSTQDGTTSVAPGSPHRISGPLPMSPRGAITGPVTYTAARDIAHLTEQLPQLAFSPIPDGGYPRVTFADPESILEGLPITRKATLRDPRTGPFVIVTFWNSGFPSPADLHPMTEAVHEIVHAATGELDPLIVPPEFDATADRRFIRAPFAWIVLGISEESAKILVERRVWSSVAATLIIYPSPSPIDLPVIRPAPSQRPRPTLFAVSASPKASWCGGLIAARGGLARMRTAYRAVSRGHGPIRAQGLAFRGAGPYGARWYVPRSALRISGRRIAASIPFAMDLP